MKEYFKFLISTIICTFAIMTIIVLSIIMFPRDTFHSSFQSVIQDKYRILKETDEPKIIIVAGSSSAFGLDQDLLEEETGYKVCNLGLHIGFGSLFYSEMAKKNINAGDIVLLGYEYGWGGHDSFDHLDQSLIMSGIDDNIGMYEVIPIRRWPEFLGYLFKYAEQKNNYEDAEGVYSRASFDPKTANMITETCYLPQYLELIVKPYDDNADISSESEEYLREFREYVESCGATIYFIAPPICVEGITGDVKVYDELLSAEEKIIGIEYISNPSDYFFSHDLMLDSKYHCNTKGAKLRTELLIKDIKEANIID